MEGALWKAVVDGAVGGLPNATELVARLPAMSLYMGHLPIKHRLFKSYRPSTSCPRRFDEGEDELGVAQEAPMIRSELVTF